MRAAFALVLILCGAGSAAAQNLADPVASVRAIYASYERDKPSAWFERDYSARLRKLIDTDRESAAKEGDAGKFDWDPIINAQDWKLSAIKISLVSKAGDRAVVDAWFHNLGSDQHMRFSLVREGAKWAIDDLQALNKSRWTMSKVFEDAPDAFPDQPAK
jgi:hypothetical protein